MCAKYYNWNKETLIVSAQISAEIRRVTFNPKDESEVNTEKSLNL